MKTANRRPLSLQGLLWLYLAAAVLVFLALGLNLVYRIDEIRTAAAGERRELAKADLRAAFVNGHQAVHRLATHLARWDEVAQQLRLPAYYHYWRSNRLPRSRELPDYVRDFDLYDAQGRTLLKRPDSLLPQRVPSSRRRFTLRQNILLHIHFVPVAARGDPATTLGYLGLAVDMLAALRAHHYFSYLDPRSLRVRPFATPAPTPATVLDHITFSPLNVERDSPLASLLKWQWLQITLLLAALVGLLYLLLHRFVSRPLGRLVRYVDRLSDHPDRLDESIHLPDLPLREFVTLKDSLLHYQRELARARHRLDAQNTELHRLAHRDHLTGAWNRLAFDEDWQHLTRMLENQRMSVAFLLFDCDHFKAINDTYGHEIGDRVLVHVGARIVAPVGSSDTAARVGGDEFAVLLEGGVSEEEVLAIGHRLVEALSGPLRTEGGTVPVAVSVGAALAPRHATEATALLRAADEALYVAKAEGGCRVRLAGPSEERVLAADWFEAFVRACEDGSLHFLYQPQVGLVDGRVRGFEALLRWRYRGGVLTADRFLAHLAHPALARRLTEWSLERACAFAARLRRRGAGMVAVNLSHAQLQLPDLPRLVDGALARHDLPAAALEIEVTEDVLLEAGEDLAARTLHALREIGVGLALDDFGTGWASLARFQQVPVQVLKIDRGFVATLHRSARAAAIVRAVCRLARVVGAQTVAEGVETTAQAELLRAYRCRFAQGYLFARPLAAEAALELAGDAARAEVPAPAAV